MNYIQEPVSRQTDFRTEASQLLLKYQFLATSFLPESRQIALGVFPRFFPTAAGLCFYERRPELQVLSTDVQELAQGHTAKRERKAGPPQSLPTSQMSTFSGS